jgi:hypothetical protein
MVVLLEEGRGPQERGCWGQCTAAPSCREQAEEKDGEPAEKASRHRKEKVEAHRRADLSNDALEPTWFQREDFE